ncbi:MAG: hypothetical protein H0Z20_05025 [Nitrosospira sp.]|nr:hypothetical protein [Nitrosospira sp.]
MVSFQLLLTHDPNQQGHHLFDRIIAGWLLVVRQAGVSVTQHPSSC